MSKYISKTKSKIKFRTDAISDVEGDSMNKVLADIMKRREEFRARQAARNAQHATHVAPQPKLDEFEKEYEAFIAEQKKLKAEREAKEAAAKAAEAEVPVDVPVETPEEEVKNDVVSEEDTTSENSEEVQVVETKPKKKSKKKKVVETTETVE